MLGDKALKIDRDGSPSADEGQTALVRDLIKSNQDHIRRYDELRHRVTNASTVDAGSTMLVANVQEETTSSGPQENYGFGCETRLEDIHHFLTLFERLEEEVTRPSYFIGLHSRNRIQREISNIQERETKSLHRVHGEAAVRFKLKLVAYEARINRKPGMQQCCVSGSQITTISTRPPQPLLSVSDTIRDQAQMPLSMGSVSSTPNSVSPSRSPGPSKSSTSRRSLKSIVDSLRYRGKSQPMALDPVTDSVHHVDPIKQPPQNEVSIVDRTAGSSHGPSVTLASISSDGCSCEVVQDSEVYRTNSSDEDLGGVAALMMASSPPSGDSRNYLASFEAHTAGLDLRSDTEHHTEHQDTDDRRGSTTMSSTYHDIASKFRPSKSQSSSSCSIPSDWTVYDPSSLADVSGHDVDVDYQSQNKRLADLLRLWTPINIPPEELGIGHERNN